MQIGLLSPLLMMDDVECDGREIVVDVECVCCERAEMLDVK